MLHFYETNETFPSCMRFFLCENKIFILMDNEIKMCIPLHVVKCIFGKISLHFATQKDTNKHVKVIQCIPIGMMCSFRMNHFLWLLFCNSISLFLINLIWFDRFVLMKAQNRMKKISTLNKLHIFNYAMLKLNCVVCNTVFCIKPIEVARGGRIKAKHI